MKGLVLKYLRLICVSSCLLGQFLAKDLNAQASQTMSLERMRKNLEKIDISINVTKSRVKESTDARFLADIYFALAEFHINKSRYMYAIKKAENEGTPNDELDFTGERRPKLEAIEIYRKVIETFPNLKTRDKAIFFMAHEQRELGILEDMVRSYGQLTREYPKSKYWVKTQVILGDYFMDKEQPELSMKFYQKVVRRPLGEETSLAYYKMGKIFIKELKNIKALNILQKAIRVDQKFKRQLKAGAIPKGTVGEDALVAAVKPYSDLTIMELRRLGPRYFNPLVFFRGLSNNKTAYRKLLKRLSQRLWIKGKYIDSTKVNFEHLRITPEVKQRVLIIEKMYKSMKNSRKPWPLRGAVEEITKTVPNIRYQDGLKAAERKKYMHDLEIYARDIATREQIRAKATQKKSDWEWVARDYESYLQAFPNTEFTQAMLFNLAESYFMSGQYAKAGLRYEYLLGLSNGRNTKKLLNFAIQSYISALRNLTDVSLLVLTQVRYGLRSTGGTFISQYPKEKSVPDIQFNILQTYYDERKFEDAVKVFRKYIKKFPDHKKATVAVNLILDSYNQIEDYKGLIAEGKRILVNRKIRNPQLKSQIRSIIEQSELKLVQTTAGDFGSASYAENLLKMASKSKGKVKKAAVLYEAFLSFKARKDPKAYQSGEMLLLQHGKTRYAKTVLAEMSRLALLTADFRRAANYFELQYEKFPRMKGSKKLLIDAARMRELMGDFAGAVRDYKRLRMSDQIPRIHYTSSNWSALARSASKERGILKFYYSGIAAYRLRGIGSARPMLISATRGRPTSFEEKQAQSHSLFLLSMGNLESYKKIQLGSGNDAQAVQAKNGKLEQLKTSLDKVIRLGDRRWSIAALYALGAAYKEFAAFMLRAPVPGGLSSAQKKQYKNAIRGQAGSYIKVAMNYFKQCVTNAEKFEIFTAFVKGCVSRGKLMVDESLDTKVIFRAGKASPSAAKKIRKKLYDDSRNTFVFTNLAAAYVKAKDYSMAELVMTRATEIEPNNATLAARVGVIQLYKNDSEGAKTWFKKALEINRRNSLALYGFAALYKKFSFNKLYRKTISKAKRSGRPKGFLHPLIKKLI